MPRLPMKSVRLTIPLVNTSVTLLDGRLLAGRMEITPGIVIAALNDAEAQRVTNALGESPHSVGFSP